MCDLFNLLFVLFITAKTPCDLEKVKVKIFKSCLGCVHVVVINLIRWGHFNVTLLTYMHLCIGCTC